MNVSELDGVSISLDIKVGDDGVDKIDISALSGITVDDLSNDMARLPSQLAFYCLLAVKSSVREQRSKANLEIVEAQLDSEFRKAGGDGDKKLTEKALAGKVRLDERYQQAYDRWLNALEEYQILQRLVMILEKKALMLQSLNADRRIERQALNFAGGS